MHNPSIISADRAKQNQTSPHTSHTGLDPSPRPLSAVIGNAAMQQFHGDSPSQCLPQETNIIQRTRANAISKATGAVIHTRKHLKAGNQRGDVIETSGYSREGLGRLRDAEIAEFLAGLKDILKKSTVGFIRKAANLDEEDYASYAETVYPFLTGALSELLGVGNCGEFAYVVYRHLVETSGERLQAYACSFTTQDHAFNLVYHAADATTPLFSDSASMQPHIDDIMVADAWANIMIPMSYYLNRNNPYGIVFPLNNVKINNSHRGLDSPVFGPDAMREIEMFAAKIRSSYSTKDAYDTSQDAILSQDMPGLYESEDITKPKTLTAIRIINLLESSISSRNNLLHEISLSQRKEVFAIMAINPQYQSLYDKCKALYSATDWWDITRA